MVYENTAPPPYTAHSEYIVLKTDDEIKVLNWDKKNNFSGLYEADGDVYIASSGYSPHNSGRWSNSFSDLYSYDKEGGKLYSIAEDFGDKFNSIEVIGLYNGEFYLKALWLMGDKNMSQIGGLCHIGMVHSGFYKLSANKRGVMEKLYPYASGEVFMAPNGTLYLNADYAREQRLINLNTGKIITFN